jgi:hypothetical protein
MAEIFNGSVLQNKNQKEIKTNNSQHCMKTVLTEPLSQYKLSIGKGGHLLVLKMLIVLVTVKNVPSYSGNQKMIWVRHTQLDQHAMTGLLIHVWTISHLQQRMSTMLTQMILAITTSYSAQKQMEESHIWLKEQIMAHHNLNIWLQSQFIP